MIQYSDLEGYLIHDLRKLGRHLGVKAPTALTKDDLIREICLISNGKKEGHVETKGRPNITPSKDIVKEFETLFADKDSIPKPIEKIPKRPTKSEKLAVVLKSLKNTLTKFCDELNLIIGELDNDIKEVKFLETLKND